MNSDWGANILNGNTISNGVSTTSVGIVPVLQSTLSGAIPVLFPVILAVSILFGGYAILKALYHSRF